ncbi:uncharacterized protein LOC113019658 isoform X2 [Astatotilapia calliptera]|uniref:uncharacterized protein LOC113019658 isoform X2 n=1 Tax=Astatotilapia calliptera TaxID=8154 RepID=UPI000E4031DD|nr:uncharacterized protein LOC113019658 isoform X2 [Astatotilapia calliptera]
MLLLLLLLTSVSQHALAVVVEVNEGERSVLLPCLFSGITPEDTTVMWTCSDLDPKSVHQRREGGDNVRGQNQRYSRRTSMNRYAFIIKDFSLTLRKPTKTDSGNYTCSISAGGKERKLRDIQLQVKEPFPSWSKVLVGLLVLLVVLGVSGGLFFHLRQYFMSGYKVVVDSGEESVRLPCKTMVRLPNDAKVEWTDNSISNRKVHVSDQVGEQDEVYKDRTEMKRNLLKPGDFCLTLKYPTDKDTHIYTCSIYSHEGNRPIMSKKVELIVKVPQVEVVDSGVQSVQLPCKATVNLPEDAKVEWTDSSHRKVHIWQNRPGNLEEQFVFYKDRTEMKNNPLTTGDLSLTLTYPTDWDGKTYTCTVYNGQGNTLMKKQVELKVRVCQVEVEEGVESVKLPFKTTENLPEDAKVQWKVSGDRMVHVFKNGSDQPEEQDQFYRDRTKINKDLLRTGDLSLTLKQPTERDSGEYRCKVYGKINRYKKVLLKVKITVPKVEVDSGIESVQLPVEIKAHLPKDIKVEWKDGSYRKIHIYQNGSDQFEEQDKVYRDRTEIDEDLLNTGDLSLTLKYPTDWDTNTYTCILLSREGKILLKRKVELKVRVCQVEVKEGVGSVQLSFKTTENLPEDAKVQWKISGERMVHVYENGSDQPEEQDQFYRDRTKMNEDLLRTGDLSLTLKQPTERDSGEYRCVVKTEEIKRYKTVFLTVKGRVQVQDQTGDIRNRSSSIDPTPLMADQSV